MEKDDLGPQEPHERELTEGDLPDWSISDAIPVKSAGHWIGLLTKKAFKALPDGTVVENLYGIPFIKGTDPIYVDGPGEQTSVGILIEGARADALTRRYGHPAERG